MIIWFREKRSNTGNPVTSCYSTGSHCSLYYPVTSCYSTGSHCSLYYPVTSCYSTGSHCSLYYPATSCYSTGSHCSLYYPVTSCYSTGSHCSLYYPPEAQWLLYLGVPPFSAINFMLGWPCILNYMNNNQHDALFFFSLLSYHTSTCFGRLSSPSSGGRMYKLGKWYWLYFWADCHRAWLDDIEVW
jgi:hypothetical protein